MDAPLLEVKNLTKLFCTKGQTLKAVDDISFTINAKEVLGIGGESGCGKSTVGKLCMGLLQPSSGQIDFQGQNLAHLMKKKNQRWRRHLQMIFQHPASSLNPCLTIEKVLAEPFQIHQTLKGKELRSKLITLLSQVGLTEDFLNRMPHELSGGQKQRIAIARALALEPKLLLCDEPFAGLDVSVQSQIVNLLSNLHKEKHLSFLLISHDLPVLRYLAHRMAIMYLGKIVEYGNSRDVFQNPMHPYTQALITAILQPNHIETKQRSHVVVKVEIPSLTHPTGGCPYYPRCPFAQKHCQTEKPVLKEVQPNHFVACHLY